jgi:6-phosphogluconolactonase
MHGIPSAASSKPFQVITTLPEAYVGGNTTAEIQLAPSGHYFYVSNRRQNSIVIFASIR